MSTQITDGKNYTLNPVTGEFEYLTPLEWKRLKCGYGKTQSVETWRLDFELSLQRALVKYLGTEKYPNAYIYLTQLMFQMGALTVDKQYEFCLWARDTFVYSDLEKFFGPIYSIRKITNEIGKLRTEVHPKPKRRRRRKLK